MRLTGAEIYHVFIVTNPYNNHADYAACTDMSDDILIQVSGAHFESEAYHLEAWAEENGFNYEHQQRRLFP